MKIVSYREPNFGSVTIIIPTYNRYKSAVSLVNSMNDRLNSLHHSNLEVILVDDNGLPNRKSMIWSDLVDLPFLKILNLPENYGAGIARNIGMQLAQNEWIAFIDDDDEIDINRLMQIAENFSHSDYEVIAHSLTPHKTYKNHLQILENFLYFKDNHESVRFLFRRDFQRKYGLQFSEGLHEDIIFCCYTLAAAGKVRILDEYLYERRLESCSVTSSMNTKRIDGYMNAIHNLWINWPTLSAPLTNRKVCQNTMILQGLAVILYQITTLTNKKEYRLSLIAYLKTSIKKKDYIYKALEYSKNKPGKTNFEKAIKAFMKHTTNKDNFGKEKLDENLQKIFCL